MRYLLGFIGILLITSAGVAATFDREEDIRNRVSIALWKPASLQVMTKTACLAMAGLRDETLRARSMEQVLTFQENLDGLIRGSQSLGLNPKYNAVETERLEELEALAQLFTPSLLQIAHRDKHSVVIQMIFDRVGWTTMRAQQYADWVLDEYVTRSLPPEDMAALRIANRTRFLSQRVLKQGCFNAHDMGGTAMQSKLLASIDDVTHHLRDLHEAIVALQDDTRAQALAQLQEAETHWFEIRAMLLAIYAGEPLDIAALDRKLQVNDALIASLDAMIESYVGPL